MDARSLLGRLRAGRSLETEEIRWFARAIGSGVASDAQVGAFAMGVCKQGLGAAETAALTAAMRDSGTVLDWNLPGPVIDKHSTGGLGDGTSLVVAPVLAALGAYAPFLSGRGLGHTGGTLDKLEAIPGVETTLAEDRLRRVVEEVGCAVAGATAAIAPADRRLYAIRDETGCVDSVPLIVASVLSKKLAGGARVMVFDVKGGTGAFMKTRAEAHALAEALVATARGAAEVRVRALITDMNQPLAPAVGNALEIAEVMAVLRDPSPQSRLCQMSLALAGEALALAGSYASAEAGARAALEALQSGAAAEKFGAMVHAMKGPAKFLDDPAAHLPTAPVVRPLPAPRAGQVAAIDGVALGQIVTQLGGGRLRADDDIDPRVGLSAIAPLGRQVTAGEPLLQVHAAKESDAERALESLSAAIQIDTQAAVPPLIHDRVG